MGLFKVVCDRPMLETGDGQVRFGDVVAVIHTELPPGTLSSMVTYGQAKLVPMEDGETPEVVGPSREAPQPEPQTASEPLPPNPDLTTNQASEQESDASSQLPPPEDLVLTSEPTDIDKMSPDIDAGTIAAVKDLGITTLDQLRERLATGERLTGIGDQRRKNLNAYLEKLNVAASSQPSVT